MSSDRKKKVLFFPWSHGIGFGYVGRALRIAQELSHADFHCVFGSDTAEGLVARCGFEVCAPKSEHGTSVPDMGVRRGDYIPLDNLDTVYAIARYYHPARVREHMQQDLAVIDQVKPDVVAIDMQPTASIAARYRGIALLSTGDSDFLRDEFNSWMPWLTAEQASMMPYPTCIDAFNIVLAELDLPSIKHVSDLLWGDLTLLASIPELEANQPPLRTRGPLEYVGPIFWDPPWSEAERLLENHHTCAEHRIYITLGHGGKVARQHFEAILQACANDKWAVFLSLGFRPPAEMPHFPPNVVVGGFTGLSKPIAWSDLVIDHGGYATVLTSLMYGKPQIIVPFMSEQEANGILFVEGQQAGFVLRKTVPVQKSGQHFEYSLRYKGISADGMYDAHEVAQAINEIYTDPRYRDGATSISARLKTYVHNRSFVDLIKNLL